MASRILLKTNSNPQLPLQFLRNPISGLTRFVVPVPQPESTNKSPQLSLKKASTFPLASMTQKPFVAGAGNGGFSLASGVIFRQMGTGRSSPAKPRGGSSREDDECYDDDDEEEDDDENEEWENEDFDDGEDDDDDDDDGDGYKEEKPKMRR